MALASLILGWQDVRKMNASENEFFLSRAASSTSGCAKSKFLSVSYQFAKVTHQGGDRHALQQSIPNRDLVEPLGRDGLARQVKAVDQTNDLALARSLFGLLEGCNDIRQPAGRSIGGDAVFTVCLALYGALTQTVNTRSFI